MFTGIISEVGRIEKIEPLEGGRELQISCSFAADTHVDESISINGVCLSVVDQNEQTFTVQCVEETLRKTTFGSIRSGDSVNLERSLTLDRAVEGHIVQGHVDTTGEVTAIELDGNDRLITIRYPEEFLDYVVGRGSVAIDGISLTVARVEQTFLTVAIIPFTWGNTNLQNLKEGDRVNLEFDIFGKYIVNYLNRRAENR